MAKNYFKPEEFQCKCGCGTDANKMDTRLVKKLNEAREYAGIPFTLTSAYRCEKHNAAVGGVKSSSHTSGKAVDIKAPTGTQKYLIVKALLHVGFNRIGVAKSFIHVDVDDNKPQDSIWLY